jgi:hypothetical protein
VTRYTIDLIAGARPNFMKIARSIQFRDEFSLGMSV